MPTESYHFGEKSLKLPERIGAKIDDFETKLVLTIININMVLNVFERSIKTLEYLSCSDLVVKLSFDTCLLM